MAHHCVSDVALLHVGLGGVPLCISHHGHSGPCGGTSWHLILHILTAIVLLILIYAHPANCIRCCSSDCFALIGQARPYCGTSSILSAKRLLTFMEPEADPLGSAYQIIQSKIAVGSALNRQRISEWNPNTMKFLPEGHTDFIFSAWGEQFGFLGTATVTSFFYGIYRYSACRTNS